MASRSTAPAADHARGASWPRALWRGCPLSRGLSREIQAQFANVGRPRRPGTRATPGHPSPIRCNLDRRAAVAFSADVAAVLKNDRCVPTGRRWLRMAEVSRTAGSRPRREDMEQSAVAVKGLDNEATMSHVPRKPGGLAAWSACSGVAGRRVLPGAPGSPPAQCASARPIDSPGGGRRTRRVAHDVLCFGDSQMKFGIAPHVVAARTGRPAYNLAIVGGQPPASYFLLRRALEAGARPSAVLFDLQGKHPCRPITTGTSATCPPDGHARRLDLAWNGSRCQPVRLPGPGASLALVSRARRRSATRFVPRCGANPAGTIPGPLACSGTGTPIEGR